MKLNTKNNLLAGLSAGALALLPAISFAADNPAAQSAGLCLEGKCEMGRPEKTSSNTDSRAFLGVVVQPLTPKLAAAFDLKENTGALVAEVMPGSPADNAGLKAGDVITAVAGKPVGEAAELRGIVGAQEPGATVDIKHMRNGKEVTAQATLGEPAKRKISTAQAEPDVLDGIGVTDLTEELRQKYNLPENIEGVIVTEVKPDSAADQAGLRRGDVIRRIGREDIQDAQQAVALSENLKGEEAVPVLLWRQGASRFIVLAAKA